jgi:hypothetical protein
VYACGGFPKEQSASPNFHCFSVISNAMADLEESKMPDGSGHRSIPEIDPKSRHASISSTRPKQVIKTARNVAKGASSTISTTGRAANNLVKRTTRTIKGGLKTTKHVLDNFRNNEDDNNDSISSSASEMMHTSESKAVLSDIEKLAQKSGTNTEHERFKVFPKYAYPKTKFNRDELRQEMNKASSYYHDLKPKDEEENSYAGSFFLEILQCFGIPRPELMKETSAFCLASCGPHAFKTGTVSQPFNRLEVSHNSAHLNILTPVMIILRCHAASR